MQNSDIFSMISEGEIAIHLLDAMRVGTWYWNLRTGSLQFNAMWAEMLGYTLEELQPATFDTYFAMLFPEDMGTPVKAFNEMLEGGTSYYNATFRLKHKAGHPVWVAASAKMINADDGKPLWFIGTHVNVTEAREQKQQLSEKTKILDRIFEVSLDLIAITDIQANFLVVNNSWQDILLYSKQDLDGKNFLDLVHSEDRSTVEAYFKDLPDAYSRNNSLVLRAQAKDGSYKYLECSSQHESGFVYIFARDISERKLIEAENERNRQKLEFTNIKQKMMMRISSLFINVGNDKFAEAIQESLRLIGVTLKCDRTYIFRYDTERRTSTNTYEWCNTGVEPFIDGLQDVPMIVMGEWPDMHLNNISVFIPDMMDLDPEDSVRQSLEPQGIQSLLSVPLKIPGLYDGFVGIDSVNALVHYTEEDENLLREYGNLLMNTMYRLHLAKKLEENEELLRLTLQSIGDGVISTDRYGKIDSINYVAQQLTGYSAEEALGKAFAEVFNVYKRGTDIKSENIVERVLSSGATCEPEQDTVLLSKNGEKIEVEDSASPILDKSGHAKGVVVVFRNCTEKRARQREIEYLSMHDVLTGLYNRRYIESISQTMDVAENYPLTIVFADVNDLKLTNDAFGHQAGDELLQLAAQIIGDSSRPRDIIGRIGGDEFVIIMPATEEDEAMAVKNAIQQKAQNSNKGGAIVSIKGAKFQQGWSYSIHRRRFCHQIYS